MALASSGRLEEVVEALFMRAVHVSRRADAALRALNMLMAEDVGSGAFLRQQTAVMGRIDSRPMLSSIRAPTLVLVGEDDELTPPDRAAEMAQGIPAARLVSVPHCGHLSTLERPREVTGALLAWLQA
jgi:pimeloyl-ACP methyl ester carboxylesterase